MKRIRVMLVLGTRPEIIRLSSLIKILDTYSDLRLIHTGQNFTETLSSVFFQDFEIRKPDIFLGGDTSSFAAFCASTFPAIEEQIREFDPEVFVTLGDTNSALSSIVAKKSGVVVYHLEAGNRSFDANVPEELNRRISDHVADFNLPYSDFARSNLLREGLSPRFIFKTGSPMRELIRTYQTQITGSNVLTRLDLKPKGYLLVSLHRQENIDAPQRLHDILNEIEEYREKSGKDVVLSAHPRFIDKAKERLHQLDAWTVSEPYSFFDYMKLQLSSFCVVSDSGSVSEEAGIAGFAAVTLRDSMERQEALEMGVVPMAGVSMSSLANAIEFSTQRESFPAIPSDYQEENFSDRVWAIILSTHAVAKSWTGERNHVKGDRH